jgi:hypothetical protein
MAENPKPIDTVSLVMGLMDFFKGAAIVMGMTIIEWARAKQAHAEDKQAVAESELKSLEAKNEIDQEHRNIQPSRIIRNFIDKRKKPGS